MQTCINLTIIFERLWSDHFGQILAWWNLFRLDLKIFQCFLARLYLDQNMSGTLEEVGVNLGKILANKNFATQQKNLNKILSDLILEYKILFQKVRS